VDLDVMSMPEKTTDVPWLLTPMSGSAATTA